MKIEWLIICLSCLFVTGSHEHDVDTRSRHDLRKRDEDKNWGTGNRELERQGGKHSGILEYRSRRLVREQERDEKTEKKDGKD